MVRVLKEAERPLTADEIHARVGRALAIHRVTLYRTLDLLVEAGAARKLSAGDRAFRYALACRCDRHEHAHFYCRGCGLMKCIEPGELPIGSLPAPELAGRLEGVELRLDGLCRECLET